MYRFGIVKMANDRMVGLIFGSQSMLKNDYNSRIEFEKNPFKLLICLLGI
jgi:hypothetical protein